MRTMFIPMMFALLNIAGCRYEFAGSAGSHFAELEIRLPSENRIDVCSAHGCRKKTEFVFNERDIKQIAEIMAPSRKANTPSEERNAIAQAIVWIETRVGAATNTSTDRARTDFSGSGDPTQLDCVDEATNTTSYLMVLRNNLLLQHHRIARPIAKGNLFMGRWPHYGAVIVDKSNSNRWIVDSWVEANGIQPMVVPLRQWLAM